MRDLAVQAANDGALTDTDKEKANEEFSALKSELDDIATLTTFNGTTMATITTTAPGFTQTCTVNLAIPSQPASCG